MPQKIKFSIGATAVILQSILNEDETTVSQFSLYIYRLGPVNSNTVNSKFVT